MGWPRITPDDAVAAMLAADLKPQVPYPGSTKPWPSTCLRCGKTVQPTVTKVRQRGHQCSYCAGQRIDEDDALRILTDAGFTPLVPYPGASRKWAVHCNNCDHDVDVVLVNVKMGRRCGYCMRRRVDPQEALAVMREAGFEPLVPYPGDRAWPSRCIAHGHEVAPRLVNVRGGVRCAKCAKERSRVTHIPDDEAAARMADYDLKPLAPFPGYGKPWPMRCLKCGKEVSPTLSHILARGQGCAYCSQKRVDPAEAEALFREAGLIPTVPYPGANKKWPCTCAKCHSEITPRYSDVRKGQQGCIYCAMRATKPEEAEAKMRAVGLEPQVPYPGANTRWPCTCTNCGRTVRPFYSSIQQGRGGCRYCAEKGIDYTAPGYLYLLTHERLNAHKVGIANFADNPTWDRVYRHAKHGWTLYKRMNFATADDAFNVEQATLKWLRDQTGNETYLTRQDMPQGGWTETVSADAIDLPTLWRRITAISDETAN